MDTATITVGEVLAKGVSVNFTKSVFFKNTRKRKSVKPTLTFYLMNM